MKLSNMTNDYQSTGGIVDRQQVVVVDTSIRDYELTYVPGSEEVYVNGERKFSGPSHEYITYEGGGKITFNQDLVAGDKVLLIGRSNVNEIPYTKAVSESVILGDGQVTVVLSSIGTDGAEFFVSGTGIDSKRLISVQDYSIVDIKTLELTSSYPAGTVLEAVQSARLAWVDPNNMLINARGTIRSISDRFEGTQESYDYYVEKNGRQIADLKVGYILSKWKMSTDTGNLIEDINGSYPTLVSSGSAWIPRISLNGKWEVYTWSFSNENLVIEAREIDSGEVRDLIYVRSEGGAGSGGGLKWEVAPDTEFEASEGFGYFLKGGVVCKLPPVPTGELTIGFKDADGTWSNSAGIIDPNGSSIEGSTDPFILNVGNAAVELVYIGGEWRLVEVGTSGSGPEEITEETFGAGSSFTLNIAPKNKASIIVLVDDSILSTSEYSLSGNTLTLNTAATGSCVVRNLGVPVPISNIQSIDVAYDDSSTKLGDNVSDALDSLYYNESSIVSDQDILTIERPRGGAYNTTGAVTGALKIELPASTDSNMLTFTVDLYNYNHNTSAQINIAGYTYIPTPSWYNTTATINGGAATPNHLIRYGMENDRFCVWIGDTDTIWEYPQVAVRNFKAGFNSPQRSDWESGWSVSFETTLGTVQHTVTDALLYGSDWDAVRGKPTTLSVINATEGDQLAALVASGMGNSKGVFLSDIDDLNIPVGSYSTTNATIGTFPVDESPYGALTQAGFSDRDHSVQTYIGATSRVLYIRSANGGVWRSWHRVMDERDVSVSSVADSVVKRDVNGYINNSFYYSSGTQSDSSDIGGIITRNGANDGFLRGSSLAQVKSALNAEPTNWVLKWSGSSPSVPNSWGLGTFCIVDTLSMRYVIEITSTNRCGGPTVTDVNGTRTHACLYSGSFQVWRGATTFSKISINEIYKAE